MYAIAIAAVVFLVPFSVNAFLQGNAIMGAGILCGVMVLGVNALAIYLGRPQPIPMILLLVPMTIATAVSLKVQGFFGALWCYPTVLLFTFGLTRRMANVCSVLLLFLISSLVYYYIGPAYTIRFFCTLTLTIILANIVLSIIGDLHRRLMDQAIVDPLTGAFNRRHMDRCLDEVIERQRRSAAPAALLLIDIDHFKRINDQLGHAKGDGVLRGIVELIRRRARRLDLLFRIGGEEFMLLLPDTQQADAAAVAEQLRASIAESALPQNWRVTASIGVSELRPGQSLDAWMKEADDAMYAAKEAGRDRVVCARRTPTVR